MKSGVKQQINGWIEEHDLNLSVDYETHKRWNYY